MAGGGGGLGDKRSANADLNLVPYIDLLSTLICFLLITAVWSQINVVSTNAQNSSSSSDSSPPTTSEIKVDLSVMIFPDKLEMKTGEVAVNIPNRDGNPDYSALMFALRDWKQKFPRRNDVTIHSDSTAPYKFLINVMDALSEADFSEIGVNTN